ncbi:hypothetical protein UFOVP276_157 [uncultured Caudovirales phage]|uniref:Uncharacterized protein n=1 Tax=uncultured Caudovirales phage TaxID=2100421 RepID=A0A6J5LLY4_9CAUD|nr:hypothetical protein UFOVP127_51 [uncultured Caudovirales phage]CAB4135201.1 hypothetical protein UFOVP276_157 [uncultured Caudovirales phage]
MIDTTLAVINQYTKTVGSLFSLCLLPPGNADKTVATVSEIMKETTEGLLREVKLLRFLREEQTPTHQDHT